MRTRSKNGKTEHQLEADEERAFQKVLAVCDHLGKFANSEDADESETAENANDAALKLREVLDVIPGPKPRKKEEAGKA